MGTYAQIKNADNTVISVVEWDGISELPEHEIDVTLIPVDAGVTPNVGDIWNGTVFMPDPTPPAEPPAEAEAEDAPKRGRHKKEQEPDFS